MSKSPLIFNIILQILVIFRGGGPRRQHQYGSPGVTLYIPQQQQVGFSSCRMAFSFGGGGSGGTGSTSSFSFPTTTTTTAAATTSSGFSFGTATAAPAGGASFNFSPAASQPTALSTGLSFGAPATTTSAGGFNFASTAAPSGTGSILASAISAPLQTAAPAAASASSFSFNAPASTAASSSFSSGFSLTGGTPAVTTGLSLGTPATSPFTFQAKTPGGGSNEATKTTASTTTQPILAFPVAKTTTGPAAATTTAAASVGSTGLSSLFPTQTSTPATTTSVLGSSAIAATAASSTPATTPALATLSTVTSTSNAAVAATTAVGAVPTLSVAGLEDKVNKWVSELREQEERLMRQAAHVNAWDQLLQQGHDQVQQLRDTLNKVKTDQTRLQAELDFIQGQQQELEQLIEPLEVAAATSTPAQHQGDRQRENMHHVAQSLDSQLRQMTDDLCKIIEHLNTSNAGSQASDPVNTVARVLSAHMDTLKWVDQNTALLTQKIDDLSRMADSKSRD
ncbi:nuclear pore glycoprotein p62 isoform X2 [Cherax quadricarinatus]|uniref:nuclear pore glycoprotein p62 isoform X2 n=1 Tax=Cherax quadricarinatus TaxID=27406 RepID=UPI002379666E|nr:nuclear pore glycoprotein p62-like isoform X2 [Cherax quadricarinatus]